MKYSCKKCGFPKALETIYLDREGVPFLLHTWWRNDVHYGYTCKL